MLSLRAVLIPLKAPQAIPPPSTSDGPQQMTISNTIRNTSALSGLLLILFLLIHLGGTLPALFATETFEAYASYLHHSNWLAPLEIGLLIVCLSHIAFSISKTIRNQQAGNTATLRSRREDPFAALASRSKVIAGFITFGFLALHLRQLRFPRPMDGHEREVLANALQHPITLITYSVGALAIGLHLVHGFEAAHRNLGWLTPINRAFIRRGGTVLAASVSGGFLLVSLGIAIGGQR